MRTLFFCAISLVALGCQEEPSTTIAYTLLDSDPPIRIVELEMAEVLPSVTLSSSTTSDPNGIEFPQGGSMSFTEDQIDFYSPTRFCAIGRAEEGGEAVTAGLSDPVFPIRDRAVEVTFALAPVEDGEVPAECQDPPANSHPRP